MFEELHVNTVSDSWKAQLRKEWVEAEAMIQGQIDA